MDLSDLRRVTGYDIKGILGMDFLQHHVVRLDFDRGKLSFLTSPGPQAGSAVPIKFVQTRLPSITVKFGTKRREQALLDTGADSSGAIGRQLFDELRKSEELQVCGEALFSTASGVTRLQEAKVAGLKLGKFRHNSLFMAESDHTLLGLGYLSRYVVTFDFPGRVMYLQQGARFAVLDKHDLSGLHLLRVDGKAVVHLVDPRSPAALAGLSSGDIIQEIDGEKAQPLDMYTIRRMLSLPGKQRQLIVQRGSESRRSVLSLAESTHAAKSNSK